MKNIKYSPITEGSYNGEKIDSILLDELGLSEALNKPTAKSKPKESKSSIPSLLKLATVLFNRFIRNRDSPNGVYFKCISCGETNMAEFADCGHYLPSTYSQLRFNELNCNSECQKCNRMDDKHLVGYRKNLANKIGLKNLEWLESHKIAEDYKWDREQLLEIINKYR